MMGNIEKIRKRIYSGVSRLIPGHDPNFLIIGSQKSGTTSLHDYLSQHPSLVGSKPKEIHYFDKYQDSGKDIDWYRSHFRHVDPFANKLYFEASPNYIYHEYVGEAISKMYPEMKMILILRDPVQRAFSAWNMYGDFFRKNDLKRFTKPVNGQENLIYKHFYKNRSAFIGFSEAIQLEVKLIEEGGDVEPSLLRRGLYAQQIKSYLKYIKSEQLLVIGFNDLVENVLPTLDLISDFLHVKNFSGLSLNLSVRNKRVYSQPMSEENLRMLGNFFEKPNQELYTLLGRQINW
jgi:hypothetical protein